MIKVDHFGEIMICLVSGGDYICSIVNDFLKFFNSKFVSNLRVK